MFDILFKSVSFGSANFGSANFKPATFGLAFILLTGGAVSCGEASAQELSQSAMNVRLDYGRDFNYTDLSIPSHQLNLSSSFSLQLFKTLAAEFDWGVAFGEVEQLKSVALTDPSLSLNWRPKGLSFEHYKVGFSTSFGLALGEVAVADSKIGNWSLGNSHRINYKNFSAGISLGYTKNFYTLTLKPNGGVNTRHTTSYSGFFSYKLLKQVTVGYRAGLSDLWPFLGKPIGVFNNRLSLSIEVNSQWYTSLGIQRRSVVYESDGSRKNTINPIGLDENSVYASVSWNVF